MSELPKVSRVVSVENHTMTVEVDSRYMHGLHPQQEAIESRNLELAEESIRDAGRKARQKMEQAVLESMFGNTKTAWYTAEDAAKRFE